MIILGFSVYSLFLKMLLLFYVKINIIFFNVQYFANSVGGPSFTEQKGEGVKGVKGVRKVKTNFCPIFSASGWAGLVGRG